MKSDPKSTEGPMGYGSQTILLGCVDRLLMLIDRESEALRSGEAIDFDDFNCRKSHALLEFTRASRSFSGKASEAVEERLTQLRTSLVENSVLLERHLRALWEISGIMIKTIEIAESDGTYSSRIYSNRYL